jgi:hypothetical protein
VVQQSFSEGKRMKGDKWSAVGSVRKDSIAVAQCISAESCKRSEAAALSGAVPLSVLFWLHNLAVADISELRKER